MKQKNIFRQFLSDRFPDDRERLAARFERYHSWLIDTNSKINLISRQTDPDDIWTVHFLDSLLSIDHADFRGRNILDFGTGGGLPGIPLAIVYPDAKITMLDSRKKKIAAIKEAAAFLELDNCDFLALRLEELEHNYHNRYDIITCRSVKIEPSYKQPLLKLLKPHGKIVLYKGEILDDARQFPTAQIFDVGTPELGARKIIIVDNGDVSRPRPLRPYF